MSKLSIRTLRDVSLWLLPAAAAASAVLMRVLPGWAALDWAFKVALAGTVGIWTNYFAIKMLFRPRRRALFGLQGLIPANRIALARAIGQGVAEDLLAPDQVFAFVERNDLIEKVGTEAVRLAHEELSKPGRRAWLRERAGRLLQKATAENIEDILGAVITKVRQAFGDEISFQRLWPSIRAELEAQLSSGPVRKALARTAMKLARRHSPAAAGWINDQLEEYIDDRGWLERQVLRFGKRVFGIGPERIQEEIRARVEDPDFGPSVLRAVESMAPDVARIMEDPKLRGALAEWFERKKEEAFRWLETEGLARGRDMVLEAMDSERFWAAVETQIDRGVEGLVAWARAQFATPGFREQATPLLRRLASNIPIADIVEDRVNGLDLDELEKLVYKVTSENLAGIEFLGGVLGCLAGLVLVREWLMLPVAALGGIVYLLGRTGWRKTGAP